jgi:hypothetical protein
VGEDNAHEHSREGDQSGEEKLKRQSANDEHGSRKRLPSSGIPVIPLDVIQGIAERQRRLVEALQAKIANLAAQYATMSEALLPNIQIVSPLSDGVTAYLRTLAPKIDLSQIVRPEWRNLSQQAARLAEGLLRLVPANLRELSAEEWRQAAVICTKEQLALAWVPRVEIVRALLGVETAEAREMLMIERTAEILSDCEDALRSIKGPNLIELLGFAIQSIEACRAGHEGASQALATNVLDTAMSQHLDAVVKLTATKATGRASELFGHELDDETTLREWRLMMVGAGIPPSYERYDYAKRDQRYSRHGTSHCVNGNQYRRANALRSILFATSLLKWLVEEMPPEEV